IKGPCKKLRIAAVDETGLRSRSTDHIIYAKEIGPVKEVRRIDSKIYSSPFTQTDPLAHPQIDTVKALTGPRISRRMIRPVCAVEVCVNIPPNVQVKGKSAARRDDGTKGNIGKTLFQP